MSKSVLYSLFLMKIWLVCKLTLTLIHTWQQNMQILDCLSHSYCKFQYVSLMYSFLSAKFTQTINIGKIHWFGWLKFTFREDRMGSKSNLIFPIRSKSVMLSYWRDSIASCGEYMLFNWRNIHEFVQNSVWSCMSGD